VTSRSEPGSRSRPAAGVTTRRVASRAVAPELDPKDGRCVAARDAVAFVRMATVAAPYAPRGRRYRRAWARRPLFLLQAMALLFGATCWTNPQRTALVAAIRPGRRAQTRFVAMQVVIGGSLGLLLATPGLFFGNLGLVVMCVNLVGFGCLAQWSTRRESPSSKNLQPDSWTVALMAQSRPGGGALDLARALLASMPAGTIVRASAATSVHARLYRALGFVADDPPPANRALRAIGARDHAGRHVPLRWESPSSH
jgi:hypothetical protein